MILRLRRLASFLGAVGMWGTISPALGETLRIGETGAVTELLRQIGPPFETYSGITLEVLPSLGTRGAINAVADGKLGLAIAGRALSLGGLFPGMVDALQQVRKRRDLSVAATDQDNADMAERTKGSLVGATLTQITTEKRDLRFVSSDGIATVENYQNGFYPHGFIKQSSGHIDVQSEIGLGTAFKLYLPRTAESAVQATAPQGGVMPLGSERILVVEDEPQVRANIVDQLRSLGYIVEQAPGGAAGVAAFEAAPYSFDLLLTDVIVPGAMAGKALAEEVARRWPATKIVFMSGYAEDAIAHQGNIEVGVLLLSKPFRKIELAQMVRQALDAVATAAPR